MAGFDPDAYLADKPQPAFDPDAYLGTPAKKDAPEEKKTLGFAPVVGAHFVRHGAYGLGDKMLAALAAMDDVARRDQNGRVDPAHPLDFMQAQVNAGMHLFSPGDHSLSEAYGRNLAFNDKAIEAGDQAHPAARWLGNGLGVGLSVAAPLGAGRLASLGTLGEEAQLAAQATAMTPRLPLGMLARQGMKSGAVVGTIGGFGGSRADSLGGTLEDTALGTLGGGALGYLAPYVAAGVGRVMGATGEKLKDIGGKMKVHSLHPTPTLGEKMADLPGGEAGVGRELLEQKLGALTRTGTAEQIDKAGEAASKVAGNLARSYDEGGGQPLDIAPAIFRAAARARDLQEEPTTKAAGVKLATLLQDYSEKYRDGTTTAADALQLKRALGNEVYGAKVALGNGDTLGGRYGEGLAEMQRGVDDALDGSLGPRFADANLRVRRLMGAGQAADRNASKTLHPIGLLPTMIGMGVGGAHGAEGGAAATIAAMLLHKYGYQAGARGAYTLGQLASGAGRFLPEASGFGASEPLREAADPYTQAVIAFLRGRQRQPDLATLADAQSSGGVR